MDILQFIGVIAIIYLIYKFIIKPKQQQKKEIDENFEWKISCLTHNHPQINEIFNDFEKKQKRLGVKNDNFYDFYTAKLFERYISVGHPSEIESLRNTIVNKVKELESTEKGVKEIQECIEKKRNFYQINSKKIN